MTEQQPDLLSLAIDDARIEYLTYGGDGPHLLFLHATGFLPWLWHPIARELAGDYRIVAPFFCNHRMADPDAGGHGWLDLARDLYRFCDALQIDELYCVGHSMGGTVTSLATAVFGLATQKMILIEPIILPREAYGIPVTTEQHPLASKAIKRRNGWQNRTEAFHYLTSKPFFQSWDDEMLELYLEYGMTECGGGGLQLTCEPDQEASLFMGSLQYNPWPVLKKIGCPTLVVEGGLSENRHFIDLPKVVAAFPRGEYRLIENAGHLIPMENPPLTVEIIRSFF